MLAVPRDEGFWEPVNLGSPSSPIFKGNNLERISKTLRCDWEETHLVLFNPIFLNIFGH